VGANELLHSREELKVAALCKFCEAKAGIARQCREKFPSVNLFVTNSPPASQKKVENLKIKM